MHKFIVLTESYNKSLGKISDPEVTEHEKRKTLQKTNVAENMFKIIIDLILPYMKRYKYKCSLYK